MKLNIFELGIFPFNSYVYGLTRAFSVPTHAFNLATRAFSPLTREFQLVTRKSELLTCGFEPVTHRFELVTRGFELETRNSQLVFYHSANLSCLCSNTYVSKREKQVIFLINS